MFARPTIRAYMGHQAAKKIQRFVRSRKSGDKRVVGGVKRGSYGSSRPIKLGGTLGSNVILPDCVQVELETAMDFYIPAGAATAAAGNYFAVILNSIVAPFNSPTYAVTTTTATATFACAGSLVQGFNIANNPLGAATIQANWGRYIVTKYRLEVCVDPGAQADLARLVIVPGGNEEIPSAVAGNVNCRCLEGQPYALAKTCSSGTVSGPGKNNTLILSGTPYKDCGKDLPMWLAGNQTLIASTPSQPIYAQVFIQELNGSNNGVALPVQCKLFQTVRLLDATEMLI